MMRIMQILRVGEIFMEQKALRVAVYCRVETADQLALEAQKETLSRYAEHLGHDQLSFYLDNGWSGLNFERPAFSRLEADIQAGLVRTVIVRSIDRIGRNSFDVIP